ncbi:MAG: hypothetical protein U9O87_11200 [Verrucomicrobiota bacterium]|nr:hypothetical protein [Verrucomicrobiota bacterium]
MERRIKIILQAYSLGEFAGIKVTIPLSPKKDGTNSSVEVILPAFEVLSRTDIKDAKPELAKPFYETFSDDIKYFWFYTFTAIIVFFAVILFLFWYFGKKRVYTKPPPPPWTVAESAIFKLREQLPMDAQTFFVKITDILKVYIEHRFKFKAAEQTTDEFLSEIQYSSSILEKTHKKSLGEFLNASDMVKFAKQRANQQQLSETLKQASEFVIETIPKELKIENP